MEKITTHTCEIFLDSSGILHIKMLKGPAMDLGDAIDNFVVAKNMTNQRPALKLVDARERRKISTEARKFIKKVNIPENHIAKAIIVNSMITKYLQDFFNSLINPAFPVKLFTSEEAALAWLKTFL
jgi:hypothetical protein